MAYMKIKPTDSLFFGSGKPFNAGADSWTDSSFLPNPSVIWGALFSVLYREGKVKTTEKEKLKIKNIYLYNEEQTTILVPAPLDIFVDSEGKRYAPTYKDIDFISNYPLNIINIVEDKEVKSIENSFIEINSLYQHYVKKSFKSLILYDFSDVFVADYKIGIKIDKNTKTAKENYLYRVDLTQFKKEWSFLVEYESDIKFNQKGILKLGGESKTAYYEKIKKPIALKSACKYKVKVLRELKEKKYFKVLFKTPVYFEDGWKPKHNGLVCANIGKPISIGGFDMETKSIKEMKKYVPAGSIFVFKKNGKIDIESEDSESYKGFGSFELLTI
jgi:CRISPR-associated protein Cmr3